MTKEFPGWLVSPGRQGGWDAFYASLPDLAPRDPGVNGVLVLHDATLPGVLARVRVFMDVFGETKDRGAAEAAANDLET